MRIACALLLASALAFAGCMQVTTTVDVKKDGSGSVTETLFMSPQFTAMMAGMGGGQMKKNPVDRAQYEARVAEMGEGVTLESVDDVKAADGREGTKAVFAFADINKLKLGMNPPKPENPGPGAGQPQPQKKEKSKPITFELKPGDAPTLLVHMPRPETDEDGEGTGAGTKPKEMSPQEQAQFNQMKQMFAGMRIWIRLRVDGTISDTNASYVNTKKDGVTLMDMKIGEMLNDPAQMKKAQEMGKITDVAVAKEKLKGLPSMRVETEETVSIQFK